MKDIKVSLICTLKNEESSIREFLDSILSQSRLPEEVVIVDGGSTDRTVEIINSYIGKCDLIKIMVKNGANIAEGRNIAIKNAKYEVIASTDAGCRIDKNWLKNLIKPFEEDPTVDVVSGWYEADVRTEFEKYVAELTSGNIKSLTREDFLPSGRSIAFRINAWKKVGGYPEHLDYAEDTVFDLNLKKADCKFEIAKDAVVYWRMRSNLRNLFRQYYNYAKWDAIAGICGPTKRYMSIAIFSLLAVILGIMSYHNLYYGVSLVIALLAYYFLRYGLTLFIKFRKSVCLYYGPAIILTLALSNILGMIVGEVRK